MTTYSTDSEGKFIPASQRPDGTWRKARRVRDGYVPQEEVPLYKSKGNRKSDLPPGMCPIVADAARRERERQEIARAKKEAGIVSGSEALTAAIEAPAKAAAKKQTATTTSSKGKKKNSASSCPSQQKTAANIETLTNGMANNLKLNDEPVDRAKQLKKLRKKIREIESIEERLSSGDIKKPEKDQLDKVKRKQGILNEINQLEQQLQLQQDGQSSSGAPSME